MHYHSDSIIDFDLSDFEQELREDCRKGVTFGSTVFERSPEVLLV